MQICKNLMKSLYYSLFRLAKHSLSIFIVPIYSLLSRWHPFTLSVPVGLFKYRIFFNNISLVSDTPYLSNTEYFRHYIPKPGDLVLDIGSEDGKQAIWFSSMVGPGGKVFTFECYPPHWPRLERICDRAANLILVKIACWNFPTSLTMLSGNTSGSNTLIPGCKGQFGQSLSANNETSTSVSCYNVQADTLDNIVRLYGLDNKRIDFLKMDIEGAELEALDGAQETLKNVSNICIAAYHVREGSATARAVADKLRALKFNVRVHPNLHVYASKRLS